MSDTINSISPDFRDVLLALNLMPDPIIINEMNGIGHPVNITTGGLTQGEDLDDISDGYRTVRLGDNFYKEDNSSYETINLYGTPIGGEWAEGTSIEYDDIEVDKSQLIKKADGYLTTRSILNQYKPEKYDKVDMGRIIPSTVNKPNTGYLDENGHLNVGGPSTEAINVIGGFLQGNVGINPDGSLDSGYDVRASIVGRGLSATGVINETPLGNIGATQLARAMANNAAFGLQQETTGRINTNPLDLLTGGELFVPNYDITVPKSKLGKVANFFSRVAGVESPVSLMASGSFNYSPKLGCVSYLQADVYASSIESNNSFIANTGKGQINALFFNLRQNCYKPVYSDSRNKEGDGINGKYYGIPGTGEESPQYKIVDSSDFPSTQGADYAGYTDAYSVCPGETNHVDVREHQWDVDLEEEIITSEYSKDLIKNPQYGFVSNAPMYIERGLVTTKTKINHGNTENPYKDNKDSLLFKTKELFNAGKIRTLITKDSNLETNMSDGLFTSYRGDGENMISKGSGVVCDGKNGKELCRVWSTMRRYNQVENLQKRSGFFTQPENNSVFREGLSQSVLGDETNGNGFAKIGPYDNESISDKVKRFMFSIENLAWADHTISLPPCEVGPGDPVSGEKGRIMWFPPYGINFTDNSTSSWETIPFIGRGEPIYTYNYSERLGTLSFQVIVDHPSVLNDLKWNGGNENKDEISTTMAGCKKPNANIKNKLTPEEVTQIEVDEATVKPHKTDNKPKIVGTYSFYFPNDSAEIQHKYEYDGGVLETIPTFGVAYDEANGTNVIQTNPQPNRTYYELNKDMDLYLSEIFSKMKFDNGKNEYKLNIIGTASVGQPGGTPSVYNNKLAEARAKWILGEIEAQGVDLDAKQYKLSTISPANEPKPNTNTIMNYELLSYKEARRVDVEIVYEPKLVEDNVTPPKPSEPPTDKLNDDKYYKVGRYTECDYFIKLKQDNEFIYDDIREQLKYFHPAFHSMTPEGLNTRLTFLKQCMRQGPTDSGDVDNLAFGRAPVCILRIGDFYHTKIVIDNLNFSYEPLVWDLNPEGIGVQPMIVNVDMSFKFIGGSSLAGPIARLQNAVSFNFFANTEVYDKRADKIEIDGEKGKIVRGEKMEPNTKEKPDKSGQKESQTNGSTNSDKKTPSVDQTTQTDKTQTKPAETFDFVPTIYLEDNTMFLYQKDMNADPLPKKTFGVNVFDKNGKLRMFDKSEPIKDQNFVKFDLVKRGSSYPSKLILIGGLVEVRFKGVIQQKIKITKNMVDDGTIL